MKKIKINFFNEYLYTEVLKNGLEIIILPNKDVKDIFVTFTSKYGGANIPFNLDGKDIKVPNGVAHFLEHKMFEQKSGPDPFTFFNKTGSYSNAFTNYYNTSYVYAGNKDFESNINYLLDFVQEPYFTDKNVEKEKGIISEEIRMYDDMPDNVIYEKILFNLFKNHPVKYPISGEVEDINKITKEDLYNCYEAFYNPSNMFLVITGNIEPKTCIEIIKNNQLKKKFNSHNLIIKEIAEPNEVQKDYEIIKMDIAVPSIAYAIKIPLDKYKDIDSRLRNRYISTIFNIFFDETSEFYEKMKDEGLLNTNIDIDTIDTPNHKVMILFFKCNDYRKLIKEVDKVIENINITKEDLERKKKVYISSSLYIFDDISAVNKLLLNAKILHNSIYTDLYENIESMNKKELDYIIDNMDISNKSIVIIEK